MNFHEEERSPKLEERQGPYRHISTHVSLKIGVDLYATATYPSSSPFLLSLSVCGLEHNHLGSAEWHRQVVFYFMQLLGRKENGLAWATRCLFYSTL